MDDAEKGATRNVRFLTALMGGLFLLALAAGCSTSEKRVLAKGKILNGGVPLKVDPKMGVTIMLAPDMEKGKNTTSYPANFNRDDATFAVPGPDGRGIPEGKYRISILLMSLKPTEWMDETNDQFSAGNTRIQRTVVGDEPIIIDLSKSEG
jgi:hypothetical protein